MRSPEPRPPPPHQTRRRYRLGCRCSGCRAANAAYVQSRRTGTPTPEPCPPETTLVDARPARLHLGLLQAQGVGYRQAATLSGVSQSRILAIRAGRARQIRADTRARVLGIPAILAHGQTITGWRTWRLLDALLGEGYTQTAIAQMLGVPGAALRLHHRHVRVRTALKVRALWNHIQAEGPALATGGRR